MNIIDKYYSYDYDRYIIVTINTKYRNNRDARLRRMHKLEHIIILLLLFIPIKIIINTNIVNINTINSIKIL